MFLRKSKLMMKKKIKKWLKNKKEDTIVFGENILRKNRKTIPVSFSIQNRHGDDSVYFFICYNTKGRNIVSVHTTKKDYGDNLETRKKIVSIMLSLDKIIVDIYGGE
jgi:hypothetical protein